MCVKAGVPPRLLGPRIFKIEVAWRQILRTGKPPFPLLFRDRTAGFNGWTITPPKVVIVISFFGASQRILRSRIAKVMSASASYGATPVTTRCCRPSRSEIHSGL